MRTILLAGALAGTVAQCGCASHEHERIDPQAVLRALEAVRVAAVASDQAASVTLEDGLTVAEASALAIRNSPSLNAARSRLDPLRASAEGADVWPDVAAGFVFTDVIADVSISGAAHSLAWVAGPSLLVEFPRPGELAAKVDAAVARLEQATADARQTEAELIRDVRLAYAQLLVARGVLALGIEQTDVAQRLHDHVASRRAAGAATDLEVELAALPLETLGAALPVLEVDVETARQRLNELMGLPPGARWAVASKLDEVSPPPPPTGDAVDALTSLAITRRPDVARTLWQHREADALLALEEARRWPKLFLGTAVVLELPLFSRFNHYAVKQALRARAAARAQVVASVHQARADVHLAHAQALAAHDVYERHARRLEDVADRALDAARAALLAGQLPLVAVLQARAQAVAARRQALEARGTWLEAAVRLQAATGELAPASPPPFDPDPDD